MGEKLFISEMLQFLANDNTTRTYGGSVLAGGTVQAPIVSGSELSLGVITSMSLSVPVAASELTALFPNATTGSLYTVASASEAYLVFKDDKGSWRYLSSSYAG